MARAGFEARQRQIEATLTAGGAPLAASVYEERDCFLMQLPEEVLILLYEQYTALYLNPATAAPLRGMAEMIVIRLGELVSKPQARRVQQAKRIREERRRVHATHAEAPGAAGMVLSEGSPGGVTKVTPVSNASQGRRDTSWESVALAAKTSV